MAGAIGLVTLALAIYSGWRRAALAGGRVGTCAGAAPGFVRLRGTVRPVGEVLKSPWSKAECVWYQVVTSVPRTGVTIHVGGSSKDRGLDDDRRQIVAQSREPFWLQDQTGRVLITPDGLEVDLNESFKVSMKVVSARDPNPQLESEELLGAGTQVTAIGELISDAPSVGRRVAEILKEWKSAPDAMKERFDTDRDGKVDAREWEAARMAARAKAEQELGGAPPTRVLSSPKDGRPFLVTLKSGAGLQRSLTTAVVSWGVVTAALLITALVQWRLSR